MSQNHKPQTLFDKIWANHLIDQQDDGTCLIYIDRHLVHEVTSPQAFEGLKNNNRKVRRPENTFAVADHNVPTTNRSKAIEDEQSRIQIETLEQNCKEFGVNLLCLREDLVVNECKDAGIPYAVINGVSNSYHIDTVDGGRELLHFFKMAVQPYRWSKLYMESMRRRKAEKALGNLLMRLVLVDLS